MTRREATHAQAVAGLIGALALSTAVGAQDVARHRDPTLPDNVPFSNVVVVGDAIHVAGHIGNVPGTVEIVPGGAGPETVQTLENIRTRLTAVGADLSDLVACTVYLTDMDDYDAMNAAYAPYFPDGFPARATVGVAELVFGASVEIACVGHRTRAPAEER